MIPLFCYLKRNQLNQLRSFTISSNIYHQKVPARRVLSSPSGMAWQPKTQGVSSWVKIIKEGSAVQSNQNNFSDEDYDGWKDRQIFLGRYCCRFTQLSDALSINNHQLQSLRSFDAIEFYCVHVGMRLNLEFKALQILHLQCKRWRFALKSKLKC